MIARYATADGTRTATHNKETNKLAVYEGLNLIAIIDVDENITPGAVWELIKNAEVPQVVKIAGHAIKMVSWNEANKRQPIVIVTCTCGDTFDDQALVNTPDDRAITMKSALSDFEIHAHFI